MTVSHARRLFGRSRFYQDDPLIPNWDAIVMLYEFREGKAAAGSINNILFDSKDPPLIGTDVIENGVFHGTYSAGVAPNWAVDAGVVPSEGVGIGGEKAQRVTNLNGVSQALKQTGRTLVAGDIYEITFSVKKEGGSGNFQVQVDGMNAMSSNTYDVADGDLSSSGFVDYHFYAVASGTSTDIFITADDTSLDFTIKDFHVKPVEGGNHLVMDFDLYDKTNRSVNSYDFQGVDEFFYIENVRVSGVDIGSNPFSAISMIKPKTTSGSGSMFAQHSSADRAFDFRLGVSGDVRLIVSANGSAIQNIDGSTNISTPASQFLCAGVGYDTPNGLGNIFINGQEDTTGYSTGPPLTVTSIWDSSERVTLGCKYGGGIPNGFFDGEIGKLAFYNGVQLNALQQNIIFNRFRGEYGI